MLHSTPPHHTQLLPGVAWVDGSPGNGWLQLPGAGGVSSASPATHDVPLKRWGDPQSPAFGDVHYYNYNSDCQNWHSYPSPRFVSEHGWQSMPGWLAYTAATGQDEWTLHAPMTEYRRALPGTRVCVHVLLLFLWNHLCIMVWWCACTCLYTCMRCCTAPMSM